MNKRSRGRGGEEEITYKKNAETRKCRDGVEERLSDKPPPGFWVLGRNHDLMMNERVQIQMLKHVDFSREYARHVGNIAFCYYK